MNLPAAERLMRKLCGAVATRFPGYADDVALITFRAKVMQEPTPFATDGSVILYNPSWIRRMNADDVGFGATCTIWMIINRARDRCGRRDMLSWQTAANLLAQDFAVLLGLPYPPMVREWRDGLLQLMPAVPTTAGKTLDTLYEEIVPYMSQVDMVGFNFRR